MPALRSTALVDALGSVRREDFVGPGPWKILKLAEAEWGYKLTRNADPKHLYDNVVVALDASRNLNNGEPAFVMRCLDDLELSPRDRFLHVGCGVGYYTAIAASALPEGTVVGVELDSELAKRARQNLRRWPNVTLVEGDGSGVVGGPIDAIFVNAGATEVLPTWLDQLATGGRLLVPLTVDLPEPWLGLGPGHMLFVARYADHFSARFTSAVVIFHCAGARTATGADVLRQAYFRGGLARVRSLRRDEHPAGPQCWLHAPGSVCPTSGRIAEPVPLDPSARPRSRPGLRAARTLSRTAGAAAASTSGRRTLQHLDQHVDGPVDRAAHDAGHSRRVIGEFDADLPERRRRRSSQARCAALRWASRQTPGDARAGEIDRTPPKNNWHNN